MLKLLFMFRYVNIGSMFHRNGHYTALIHINSTPMYYDGLAAEPHVVPLETVNITSHQVQHAFFVLKVY